MTLETTSGRQSPPATGSGVDPLLRRLQAFVAAAVFLEVVLFATLGPLLPEFKRELSLSTWQSGVLVAVYAFGFLVASIPSAAVSARIGVKLTTTAGLALLGTMGMLFAFAQSYEALVVARFLQGVGGAVATGAALAWLLELAPRERRGSMIGSALGVASAGQVTGPVLGGFAAAIGREPCFAGLAVFTMLLAVAALWLPAASTHRAELGFRVALGYRATRSAMWLVVVPAMVFGGLLTLGPLGLAALGVSSSAIAAVFGIAAATGILTRPLAGRWADHSGRLRPVKAGLVIAAVMLGWLTIADGQGSASVALALAVTAIGFCFPGSVALLSDACDRAGVPQLVAIAFVNVAWTVGNIGGSAGGGAVAGAVGLPGTYAVIAAITAATFVTLAFMPRLAVQPRWR